MELACDFAPEVECKWGDSGLDDIIQDPSIQGVAVVLAGHAQVWLIWTIMLTVAMRFYCLFPRFMLDKLIYTIISHALQMNHSFILLVFCTCI